MRLLNVHSYELKRFQGSDHPDYAILSHTWGSEGDEVTFQEMQSWSEQPKHSSQAPLWTKPGFRKIKNCCELASSHQLEWLWIDTCNIDKTSSAELSEAVNSMFRWYQESYICYVYLVDVQDGENAIREDSSFSRSRWFKRGWTLQELIAPEKVSFYSQAWTYIGDRSRLAARIHRICGVPSELFLQRDPSRYSIAQRMSWAARRQTTRKEDEAYCLFGLFQINLPLLYGEGSRAFQRLQEEIVKTTRDQSIFGWGFRQPADLALSKRVAPYVSALAQSPAEFAGCAEVVPCIAWKPHITTEFEITKKGIKIELPLLEHDQLLNFSIPNKSPNVAVLNCCVTSDNTQLIAVPMIFPSRHGNYDWKRDDLLLGRQLTPEPFLIPGFDIDHFRLAQGHLQLGPVGEKSLMSGHAFEDSIKVSGAGFKLKILHKSEGIKTIIDQFDNIHIYEQEKQLPKSIAIRCGHLDTTDEFLLIIGITGIPLEKMGIQPPERTYECRLVEIKDARIRAFAAFAASTLNPTKEIRTGISKVCLRETFRTIAGLGMGSIEFTSKRNVIWKARKDHGLDLYFAMVSLIVGVTLLVLIVLFLQDLASLVSFGITMLIIVLIFQVSMPAGTGARLSDDIRFYFEEHFVYKNKIVINCSKRSITTDSLFDFREAIS